jgi:hypothetical protein
MVWRQGAEHGPGQRLTCSRCWGNAVSSANTGAQGPARWQVRSQGAKCGLLVYCSEGAVGCAALLTRR